MSDLHADWEARQRARWLRPDAARFMRADYKRCLQNDYERRFLPPALDRKYRPDQPRDSWGRWVDAGGANATSTETGITDHRVLSDASEDPIVPGAQYAQNRVRNPLTTIRINGQQFELTPAQAARLAIAEARADFSTARVREIDPKWKPTQSWAQTPEGIIKAYNAEAREAQDRAYELSRQGIAPGPFAGESIPARGPKCDFTAAERREINRIGEATGCHTCGTLYPGTMRRNFVPDHQPPSALNSSGRAQRLYPQCAWCSKQQGGAVRRFQTGKYK
jgi:hypothetical protein